MSTISLERTPPIRRVRLDAGKRNVLTIEAVEALTEALAHDAEAPVVVLSGRPDGFSAGLDNATLAGDPKDRDRLLSSMGALLVSLLTSPTRVVSICEGHAVAAGAMLLLVSDIRLGVPGQYKMGFTEPALGMPLPELPALLARMRLDRKRFHELGVLGRTVGPDEGAASGFLDAIVSPDEVEGVALEQARSVATLTEAAYLGSLRAVWGETLERIAASAQPR